MRNAENVSDLMALIGCGQIPQICTLTFADAEAWNREKVTRSAWLPFYFWSVYLYFS